MCTDFFMLPKAITVCQRLLRVAALGAFVLMGQAAYALTAGDVAVIGYRSDDPDGIAFVTWVDLAAGTSLYFTDSGFFSDGTLRDSEDIMTWTAPAGGVSAGTVVTVSCPYGAGTGATADIGTVALKLAGLSTSGDQIFVGSAAFPHNGDTSKPGSTYAGILLFGLTTEKAWLTSGELTGTSDSFLPSALSGANVRLTKNNGQYTGPRTGHSVAEYKAATLNVANWTTEDNGTTVLDSTDFSVAGVPQTPTLSITHPSAETLTVPNTTTLQGLAGSSSNAVGTIVWSNRLTHASGTLATSADWSVPAIALDVGTNVILVTATNAVGTAASDSVTVTREPVPLPSVTISDPSSESVTVDSTTDAYTLTGTAQNIVGTMTWSNSLTMDTGSFAAAADWSVPGAPLGVGINVFTVSASNSVGALVSGTVTIIRPAAPGTGKPDFEVTAMTTTPATLTPGCTFSATVRVVNDGSASGDAGVLRLWLDHRSSATNNEPGVVDRPVGRLALGGITNITFTGLTATNAIGTFTLRAFQDANNATSEQSEGNNQLTLSYTFEQNVGPGYTERPDFAVTNMAFVGAVPTVTEESYSVRVTIANRGQIAGDGGMLYLFASKANPAVPGDEAHADAAVPLGMFDSTGAGSVKTFELELKTQNMRGVQAVRAYVVSPETEWSIGDNQLTVSCWIQTVTVQIRTEPGRGVVLTWNNYWDDVYAVYRKIGNLGVFEPLATDIPSARPEGAAYNEFTDTHPPAGSAFYKVVIQTQ